MKKQNGVNIFGVPMKKSYLSLHPVNNDSQTLSSALQECSQTERAKKNTIGIRHLPLPFVNNAIWRNVVCVCQSKLSALRECTRLGNTLAWSFFSCCTLRSRWEAKVQRHRRRSGNTGSHKTPALPRHRFPSCWHSEAWRWRVKSGRQHTTGCREWLLRGERYEGGKLWRSYKTSVHWTTRLRRETRQVNSACRGRERHDALAQYCRR